MYQLIIWRPWFKCRWPPNR